MSTERSMDRRDWLKTSSFGLAGLVLPLSTEAAKMPPTKLTFGLCADVHQDIMHDAPGRLSVFIEDMTRREVGLILQLGDFCVPHQRNQKFMDVWNGFAGPRYHVLGNHDTDGGYDQATTMKFWGMPERFYTFVRDGFRFIVLDGNDVKPNDRAPGYPRFIAKDQLEWLSKALTNSEEPTLIFSHQSLENPSGVENGEEVRGIIEQSGKGKVIACLSGHHHIDELKTIHGIPYIQVNSMSYFWLGDKYLKVRYSDEIDAKYPYIKYTAPYRDALYTVVTLDGEAKTMSLEGRTSQFVGPSPAELGYPESPSVQKGSVVAQIRERTVRFA